MLSNALAQHPDSDHRLLLKDEFAVKAAARIEGDDSDRLDAFTSKLDSVPAMRQLLHRYHHRVYSACLVLLGLLFLSGLGAASSLLTSHQDRVNLLDVTVFSVIVPLLALLLWVVLSLVTLRRPGLTVSTGFIGRLILGFSGWLADVFLTGTAPKDRIAALRALHQLSQQPRLSKWMMNTLTHAGWLSFTLGACIGTAARLVTSQYDFYWGSTLLSAASVERLLHGLFWLPGRIMNIPIDSALINASQLGVMTDSATRFDWAVLLLGSIGLYGILPRLLLWWLSTWNMKRSVSALPSNYSLPVYRQVLQRIYQAQAPVSGPEAAYPTPSPSPAAQPAGTPALVAFELDEGIDWPPAIMGPLPVDLGHVRGSADFRRAVQTLNAMEKPVSIVAFCALGRSPDRSTLDRLRTLQDSALSPLSLVLVDRDTRGQDQHDRQARHADWTERAHAHGLLRVIRRRAIDLHDLQALLAELPLHEQAGDTP